MSRSQRQAGQKETICHEQEVVVVVGRVFDGLMSVINVFDNKRFTWNCLYLVVVFFLAQHQCETEAGP